MPWVTWVLIAINVLVFIFVNRGMTIEQEVANAYGRSLNNANPVTFVTSIFLHGDFFHLAGNMLFLTVVGLAVEGRMKWWRFLPMYFLAGFAGGILHLAIFGPMFPDRPSIGASGAVMGVMGAAVYMFPHSRVEFFYWWYYRFGILEWPMWGVAAYYAAWDLLSVLIFGGRSGVGNLAHLGGAFAGLLIAFVLRIKRDDSYVSQAKTVIAEGGDYLLLDSTQLKDLGRLEPDNSAVTLACLTRIIKDRYRLDPEVLARLKKQMPSILSKPDQVQSAAWVVLMLREEAGLSMETVLRLALEVEKTDDYRQAKVLFDWIVRADGVSDEDRQMAAYRLAMILEVKELNFIQAQAMYRWLAETYPMGSMSDIARTRMNALEPLAAKQRGPNGS